MTTAQVLLVPYDSGHRNLRMGSGPEHFVNNGLIQVLQADGYEVSVETVESQAEFRAEVQTQFELYRSLANRVSEARQNGKFPLVLSGNCGATVGVIAGVRTKPLGVIWFDTHGECNTPETTTSGFLDGMGLAIATGLCWKKLATSIPGFRPIPGSNILHIGGHDFDEGERERLEGTGALVINSATLEKTGLRAALHPVITEFRHRVEEVHLHIDLDALNPTEAPANQYVTESIGLSVEEMSETIELIKEILPITSATIASFDPTFDLQGRTLRAGFRLMKQILHHE
jgi:arginase